MDRTVVSTLTHLATATQTATATVLATTTATEVQEVLPTGLAECLGQVSKRDILEGLRLTAID